jgi:hypothetical protein
VDVVGRMRGKSWREGIEVVRGRAESSPADSLLYGYLVLAIIVAETGKTLR